MNFQDASVLKARTHLADSAFFNFPREINYGDWPPKAGLKLRGIVK
jgi:hypothetical protein